MFHGEHGATCSTWNIFFGAARQAGTTAPFHAEPRSCALPDLKYITEGLSNERSIRCVFCSCVFRLFERRLESAVGDSLWEKEKRIVGSQNAFNDEVPFCSQITTRFTGLIATRLRVSITDLLRFDGTWCAGASNRWIGRSSLPYSSRDGAECFAERSTP